MQVSLMDVIQTITPAFLCVVGWGVRLVWSEIRDLRKELKEYVQQEHCRIHRQGIQRQLNALHKQGE